MSMSILYKIFILAIFYPKYVVSRCIENYAVVIDAGSTGSRCFLYRIQLSENGNKNVTGTRINKARPGLSSFVTEPYKAALHIAPLLIKAAQQVPRSCFSKTKVFIKGTAGMRLLAPEEQEMIWTRLTTDLNQMSEIPFFIDQNNFGTINGDDEAYYAVLASNFIAGTIDANLNAINESSLVGALDMGGSSTQLIFYNHSGLPEKLQYDHFWCHSWLNYGVERIRDKVFEYLVQNHFDSNNISFPSTNENIVYIDNPCGFVSQEEIYSDKIVLVGNGRGKDCSRVIRQIIWPNNNCRPGNACPIDGIQHPSVRGHPFYGMSVYFFALDCVWDQGPRELPTWPTSSINELEVATLMFCAMEWSDLDPSLIPESDISEEDAPVVMDKSTRHRHLYTRTNQMPYRCLESIYILTLLEQGFGFNRYSRAITYALEIQGSEVEWTLGYALAEVTFENHCYTNCGDVMILHAVGERIDVIKNSIALIWKKCSVLVRYTHHIIFKLIDGIHQWMKKLYNISSRLQSNIDRKVV